MTAAVKSLTALSGREVSLGWREVLTVRARLLGLQRGGRTSANGSCRLLRTTDGWVALNLARSEDISCIEALTGRAPGSAIWQHVERFAATCHSDRFAEQARLLSMPVGVLRRPAAGASLPWAVEQRWTARARIGLRGLSVVDLSSLWAGPLSAKILREAGADVVKVESTTRPDGARAAPSFYEWLHGSDEPCAQLDLASPAGRRELRELIEGADVVIEASRPRALEQLGSGPDRLRVRPGRVWLSLTGYGRTPPGSAWVAFGDDAAVAGGLVGWDEQDEPLFLADAVADPVSGMFGAIAILESLARGGGELLDLSMAAASAWVARGQRWDRRPGA